MTEIFEFEIYPIQLDIGVEIWKAAVENSHIEIVKILIKNKVVCTRYDALRQSIKINNCEMFKIIADNNDNSLYIPYHHDLLRTAAYAGEIDMMKCILQTYSLARMDSSVISTASYSGNLKIVKWILENPQVEETEGYTSINSVPITVNFIPIAALQGIYAASTSGQLNVIKYLADKVYDFENEKPFIRELSQNHSHIQEWLDNL
jgi:hypothetical protein